MKTYYIYFHINPLKNEVFYVGKGNNNRAYDKCNRNRYWYYTVKKYGYVIDIIELNLTEEEAHRKEINYIKRYGLKIKGTGSLVNLTEGGEGVSGFKFSEESRKKMSNAQKGKKFSDERRLKMSLASKGKPKSKEHVKNISISLKGKKKERKKGVFMTEEHKRKISEANKKPKTKEHIEKLKTADKSKLYKAIVQLDLNNNYITEYESIAIAQKITGINREYMTNVCKNKKHFITAGGFKWKFKEDYLK